MPLASSDATTDYYSIAVHQFNQRILPSGFRATPVWGYGSTTDTFNYLSFSIEARGTNPRAYSGPVPMVPHLHGGHATDESDGYPEAWFLPAAGNIPAGFAQTGSWYDFFKTRALNLWGTAWAPGSSTFPYRNDQRASTLWFHDHTLGMTRVNVYAGPAGFYLLRGGADDLAPGILPGPRFLTLEMSRPDCRSGRLEPTEASCRRRFGSIVSSWDQQSARTLSSTSRTCQPGPRSFC
jgi:spore coat protein A, manganese oxidase